MPKTTVLQANQTQFFSSKRLFISKIIMPITSTAVAVMFTFSFGSAFATPTMSNVVADRTAAVAKITKAYDDALQTLNGALATAKAGAKNPSGNPINSLNATAAEWNAACDEAFEAVKAKLDVQLSKAYQKLGEAEIAASAYSGGILGYEFATTPAPATADGYVYFKDAIDQIDLSAIDDATVTYVTGTLVNVWDNSAFQNIDASKVMYTNALAATTQLIDKYDLEKFSKDDKVTFAGQTRSSYEWAVAKRADALARLSAFGDYGTSKKIAGDAESTTFDKAAVEDVYKIEHEGTEGENHTGKFIDGYNATKFPAMATLKTTQASLSDSARIDYAKNQALTAIKQAIEEKRATDVKAQNDIIFNQSIATKPNQKAIDDAKKKIEELNETYDNMLKVFEERFANASYRVANNSYGPTVYAEYNNAAYAGLTGQTDLGYWDGTTYRPQGILIDGVTYAEVLTVLTEANAQTILDNVAKLTKRAELLKASVAIDGATALEIDEALKAAIADEYMNVGTGTLDYAWSDTVVHNHAHQLLGYDCSGETITGKVTIDGKKYNRLNAWTTDGYSDKNTKAVKAIIKDAKAAVKAAATVEAADKAFVEAYAKYEAVLTKVKQQELFNYGGALYKKDTAAKAELAAYIDYKVSLQGDKKADANTAAAIKEYFNIDLTTTYVQTAEKADFLAEVVDDASLQAAIADVKAKVDALMTKDEMKAKGVELTTAVNAVVRAVALTQEADVLALYDKVVEYKDYCNMVNYNYPMTAQEELLKTDIERLEDLQLAALKEMKDALPTVAKLTLEKREAVSAFADAQDAYNDKYGTDGTYKAALKVAADYTAADEYSSKIWELRVDAVEALIAALPVNPTTAQVKAAQDALDDLGFKGLCDVAPYLLTKLSKFTQDANYAETAAVTSLKLTAKSSAKKGSITVKWTVKGDASAADGYQVWKSTKQSKGYKKAITTTKKSYKNTKGLKKGTRYYYKVRAYKVVDGKKVYSDWSNKAYRVAK